MTQLILPTLPDNLTSLYTYQSEIQTKSLLHLNGEERYKGSLIFLEKVLNAIFEITKTYKNKDENELTIQYIGIRLFNDITAALKLLLSGYYQIAFSVQRDIIEVCFLLDYFHSNRTEIAVWRNADEHLLKTKFKAVAIREALDERDGLKEKKRYKIYQMFCNYATHISYKGNKIVCPRGLGEIGSFFDEKYMEACYNELLKWSVLGSFYYYQMFELPQNFIKLKADYIISVQEWWSKTYGSALMGTEIQNIEEIKFLLNQLKVV